MAVPAECASAQAGGGCNCPAPKLQPFTGHVFDQATGKPIAGASVHFLDDNPPMGRNMKPLRGFTLGEVETGPDGSYTLPEDLPLSTYEIRITAPGYYGYKFYDMPRIIGERLPDRFPRPSHEVHLLPSHGLVAIGASRLPGAENKNPYGNMLNSAAFAPGSGSLVAAGAVPGLWLITLADGQVRRIDLPDDLVKPNVSIGAVVWDGTNLRFLATDNNGQAPGAFIGSASAPDFRVSLLSAPNPGQAPAIVGKPTDGGDRFKIEEVSGCDNDPDPSPHCGQSASLEAHDTQTGRTVEVFSGMVGHLSYLQDKTGGGLIAFAEDAPNARLEPWMGSDARFVPGLTLLNLTTGSRTHIQIPGQFGSDINLVGERMFPEGGPIQAMRLAYTIGGDCDPASSDQSQPFAPGGPMGFTRNNWSLCIIDIPLPPPVNPPSAGQASKADAQAALAVREMPSLSRLAR